MAISIKEIKSRGIPLKGNDIDTDRIIPARFLKCITFDGLGAHAFEDDRRDTEGKSLNHPFDNSSFKGGEILVVNKNFGCGSSREHAPQALQKYGIKAVVGESFAEIFFGNCVSLGIPCLVMGEKDIQTLQNLIEKNPQARIEIDLSTLTLKISGSVFSFKISPAVQEQFLKGYWDVTGILMDNLESIKKVAAKLPYLQW